MNEKMEFIKSWGKLIKLETMTMAGRVNLSFIVVLILFIALYTTNDMLCYLISAVRDTIKTIALQQDISDPYQTISVSKIVIPILILIIMCMFYLHLNDNKKKKIESTGGQRYVSQLTKRTESKSVKR